LKQFARTAWRLVTSPFAWLGPEAAKSGPAVYRRTWLFMAAAVIIANAAGAVVVFAFAVWVIPTDVDRSGGVVLVNLVAAGVYVLVSMVIGTTWATRSFASTRAFLREERKPDQREQRVVLRGPFRLGLIAAVLWAVAVPVFAGLNAAFDMELLLPVGLTVALGGITTSAIVYLLAERILRAITARALAADPPDRPLVPGVIFRSLLAWALGAGVAIFGLLMIALFAAVERDITRTDLTVAIFGLGGLSLVIGLLATVLAARAASDPIVSVRDAMSEVERGDLDVDVPVYDGSEVGLLQAGFNRMVDGLRDRQRLREAFGTYVDHEVAERILEEGVSLEGEEVDVTALFLDVRDFTGFAERSDARAVVQALNGLYEKAVPIVHEHGGHIDKFVGDGLLAVFGAPRRDEEHADHALDAACEIAAAVRDSDDLDLEIGIGLNSGPVVAGNVGGGGRLEFSVMGDAVNVAARIEAATRETGDTVLLSEHTKQRLERGDRELEERPDVELKGKSENVKLYGVADG
jgi:adenylate cyclase